MVSCDKVWNGMQEKHARARELEKTNEVARRDGRSSFVAVK